MGIHIKEETGNAEARRGFLRAIEPGGDEEGGKAQYKGERLEILWPRGAKRGRGSAGTYGTL